MVYFVTESDDIRRYKLLILQNKSMKDECSKQNVAKIVWYKPITLNNKDMTMNSVR